MEDSLVCGYNLKKIDLFLAPECFICGNCRKIFTRSTICYHVDNCFLLMNGNRKIGIGNASGNISTKGSNGKKDEKFPVHIIFSNIEFILYIYIFFLHYFFFFVCDNA